MIADGREMEGNYMLSSAPAGTSSIIVTSVRLPHLFEYLLEPLPPDKEPDMDLGYLDGPDQPD